MRQCQLYTCLVAFSALAPAALAQGTAAPRSAPDATCTDCNTNPDGTPTQKPSLAKRAWLSICRDFRRNNAWPDPYVAADRVNTRVPFDICTANGWRIQNTLSDHHFTDTGDLTEAGELRVAAIINETPLPYRAIFVLRADDPGITAERVVSIQEGVAKILGDRPPVPIYETYEKPRGTPAYYVDEVTRRFQATIPDPRLPEEQDAGVSSSSSNSMQSR
jgi:hypothetical protein